MSAAVRLFAAAGSRTATRSARFMVHRSGFSDLDAGRYTAIELRDMADKRDHWDQELLEYLQGRGVRFSQGNIERFNSGEAVYFNGTSALLMGLATRIELTAEEHKRNLHAQWSGWRNSVIKSAARDVVLQYRAQHSIGRVPGGQSLLGRQRALVF